jgi:hypothetical protein
MARLHGRLLETGAGETGRRNRLWKSKPEPEGRFVAVLGPGGSGKRIVIVVTLEWNAIKGRKGVIVPILPRPQPHVSDFPYRCSRAPC